MIRSKSPLAAFCLGLMLSGSFAVPRPDFAQEAPAEGVKRKVRSKVVPEYPALAKQVNAQGKVKIEATVSAGGRVISTKVIGGNPLLATSALEAAKQWRFEPGPKETTELVEFDFSTAKPRAN